MRKAIFFILLGLTACREGATQARTEKNVVYGMYSGLALLMDVHYPEKANGYGVVFVAGSGWRAPPEYGATGLKDTEDQRSPWGRTLLQAGYTVFAINHRAAPRFQYPAALEDVQRAVRFVRHNARQFRIDPDRLGGVGGSSGAHLVSLVALLGAPGIAEDPDPVNRQAATLQAVVLRAAPSDLKQLTTRVGAMAAGSFMGRPFSNTPDVESAYAAASPVSHVSASSPPVLLIHGDADDTVPFQQSVAMEAALRTAGVPVKLVRLEGGEHGTTFTANSKAHRQLPETLVEMVLWLNRHLKSA